MRKEKGKDDNRVKYGTVSLPLPLIEKIKEKMKGTGMTSVSSYVSYVMRQILSLDNVSKNAPEDEIKNSLKKLGYL